MSCEMQVDTVSSLQEAPNAALSWFKPKEEWNERPAGLTRSPTHEHRICFLLFVSFCGLGFLITFLPSNLLFPGRKSVLFLNATHPKFVIHVFPLHVNLFIIHE